MNLENNVQKMKMLNKLGHAENTKRKLKEWLG